MPQGSDLSILIAEDSREMTRIVRSLLGRLGFSDIDEVPDGTAALTKLKKRRYDLLISDIHMEPMDGLELASKVRGDEELGAVRVIIMSGSGEQAKVLRAKEIGVDGYLLKPFSIAPLKRVVGGVLRQNDIRAEAA